MTWTYAQRTGLLYQDGKAVGQGYSGALPEGKNIPTMQAAKNVGPIPRGRWVITGGPFNSPSHGPLCLSLQPLPDTEVFGRSGFLIHGDSILNPGGASQGCIILTREVRQRIVASGDRDLEVVEDVSLAVA